MSPGGCTYIEPFYKNAHIADKSLADNETNNVIVFGDLAAPGTLLVLLHELAHPEEPFTTKEEEVKHKIALYGQQSNPSDALYVLRK